MTRFTRMVVCAAALAGLVACGTIGDGDGLRGTQGQFAKMTDPCIRQAARMTGLSQEAVAVTDRIRTGGGPLLILNAGGAKYSCRLEDDGGVTVFSEFAN